LNWVKIASLAKSKITRRSNKMQEVRILGISGSPRKNGNTTKLVTKALEGAMGVSGVKTEMYEMAAKKIRHCLACYDCHHTGACAFKDDFQDFVERYMEADGIIWGAPVYHMSIPASMKAALDRLGNSDIGHWSKLGGGFPRYSKVCGVLTVGGSRYGGQELTMSFLINSCLIMNGVVVSGDTLVGSYIGAPALAVPTKVDKTTGINWVKRRDLVLDDEKGIECAINLGKRVAEMTRIVKAGMAVLEKELPSEYFYKWEELGK
jgi:multimeric flavodoxin WrbA